MRHGNVHSANAWQALLHPIVEWYRPLPLPEFFRGDPAFAIPELYAYLEAEGYSYAIRLKANNVLRRHIAHRLRRPVGRPPHKPKVFHHSFQYQAGSWDTPRRVVAKVAWHAGELFPRMGFIVTNLRLRSKKEGKNAVTWTRLSCHGFQDNQVRRQLFALAYSLGNFLRRLALPRPVKHWSLTTLREKLIKIGAKVVHHARYVTFQMAEVAVPRQLFRGILDRIRRLRLLPAQATAG